MCGGEIDRSGVPRCLEIKECAVAAGIGRNAREKNFAGFDFSAQIVGKEKVKKRNRGGWAVTDCVASS